MNKKKKAVVLAVCILVCVAAAGGTFAWYLREDAKRARMEKAVVMAPYNLYLMNPNSTDALQFAVGNLHPGEVKQTVICVSNKRPENYEGDDSGVGEQAKDSAFGYDLMLAHTDNLAVDYAVYPLERHADDGKTKLPEGAIVMEDDTKGSYYWTITGCAGGGSQELTGSDISADGKYDMRQKAGIENETGVVNVGTYYLYTGEDNPDMSLAYDTAAGGEAGYEYDYYLIEVTWEDIDNFEAYKKETDLVYVVVNAKQPRPVEN